MWQEADHIKTKKEESGFVPGAIEPTFKAKIVASSSSERQHKQPSIMSAHSVPETFW
jgi:hypothetical protein